MKQVSIGVGTCFRFTIKLNKFMKKNAIFRISVVFSLLLTGSYHSYAQVENPKPIINASLTGTVRTITGGNGSAGSCYAPSKNRQ